jgi:Flp pilus assembly pilin Flp
MRRALVRFLREQRGVSAVEYGVIAGVFATALLVCFTVFGQTLATMSQDVRDHLLTAEAPIP